MSEIKPKTKKQNKASKSLKLIKLAFMMYNFSLSRQDCS